MIGEESLQFHNSSGYHQRINTIFTGSVTGGPRRLSTVNGRSTNTQRLLLARNRRERDHIPPSLIAKYGINLDRTDQRMMLDSAYQPASYPRAPLEPSRVHCARQGNGLPLSSMRADALDFTHGMQQSHAQASSSGLRKVWNVIKEAKKGDCLGSDATLLHLREAVKEVSLEELGLAVDAAREHAGLGTHNSRKITYLHVYEDEDLSVGIFCLPARSRIPLHDHPGMSVVSRVLFGDLHIRSFDWDPAIPCSPSAERIALGVSDRVLRSSDVPVILRPSSGGNIHQFTALTDCAVLDLLSPPYSTEHSRDCTYYMLKKVMDDGRVILAEYEPPSDFSIRACLANLIVCDTDDFQ